MDGGGKQMRKNVPAEVTPAGGGEDKRMFTPRLSSAPTIAPQTLPSQDEHARDTQQRYSDFSYRIFPLFHGMRFPQQLLLLGGCKGLSSQRQADGTNSAPASIHPTEQKTCVVKKKKKHASVPGAKF